MTKAGRHVDLSHVVENGMVTYTGLPAPKISDFLSRADSRTRSSPGTEFQIGLIEICANTGTSVDSPFHRYPERPDLAGVDASAAPRRAIDRGQLLAYDVGDNAVLVRTGWDRHWRTDAYFTGHPFLTQDAARCLVERGALVVGIDSYNIDDSSGGDRPVHSTLLAAGVPICEHLTGLEQLRS